MLHWLQKQLVSSETADWIDDCARWVIEQFGAQAFWQHTQLVLPDDRYFPEKVDGPEPMAQYILERVAQLSGTADWPWQLCDLRRVSPAAPVLLGLDSARRHLSSSQSPALGDRVLQVPFVVDQVTKPQDLVATLAHTCAQHMLWQSQQTPPGGLSCFEPAAEVLASFCGFGIMLTNSAYTFRGSCARCYNPKANRQASLSEDESIYTLALFCHLKQAATADVFKYLKPHLKGSFKLATKQIKSRAPLFSNSPRLLTAPNA